MAIVNYSDYKLAKLVNQYKDIISGKIVIPDEEAIELGLLDYQPNEEQPGEDHTFEVQTKAETSMFSVGDIMVRDNTTNKFKFRTYDNYDPTDNNLEPIAVCVIPDNFYTTDNCARWMHINELNINGKNKFKWDVTITTDEQGRYITEHGYVYRKDGQHINCAACYPIINADDSFEPTNTIQKWDIIGILPIDDGPFRNATFVNSISNEYDKESLTDIGCHYNAGYSVNTPNHENLIPSPYIFEQNGYYTYNTDFYNVQAENQISNNALCNLQGIANTYWIATSEYAEDYEAVKYVQNLKISPLRSLDSTYSGSWYIPSAAESTFIITRINTINASLVKCGGTPIAYDTIHAQNGGYNEELTADQQIYENYWTSTEASKHTAVCFQGFWRNNNVPNGYKVGGQIGDGYKYWEYAVRPFMMIYMHPTYGLSNICAKYKNDNDSTLQLLPLTNIFDTTDFE